MKSFKYFDLNNNGTVEPEEFAKAIEKIGIMIPTKQVSFPLPNSILLGLQAYNKLYVLQTAKDTYLIF